MDVSLTPELDEFVKAKIASGRYRSASEVVHEALRLMDERDQTRAGELACFSDELERRLAALDRGEHVEATAARAHLAQRSSQRG